MSSFFANNKILNKIHLRFENDIQSLKNKQTKFDQDLKDMQMTLNT